MMQRNIIIIFIFLLFPFIANAEKFPIADIKMLHNSSGTQVYGTDYNNQEKLIFNSPYYSEDPTALSIGQDRDVVAILFNYNNYTNHGIVYFDLPTGKVSPVFTNRFIDYIFKKIIMLYDKQKNTYTIIPLFEPCKKPFIYQDTVKTNGPELYSTFLPNGNLYIKSYEIPGGKNHFFIIKINYPKLFADCRGE
jgi:hypothetical protein